ncbi:MAG: Crp/Fnr family transcriptional regulator [Acidobacteria bacterium]|nr:Crp/Fnr family transcriptional regulator [Acidobacteriota bacterium]
MAKSDLLQRSPLFQSLEPAEMQALAQVAAERRYEAGRVLFHEGDTCEGMHVVVAGRVKIFKISASGREMTIAVESAPSTVAELPLFDGGPYPASVSALDDVTSLFIDKRDFVRLCRQHPDVALKMLAVVGRRLRHLVAMIEGLTFGSLRQRLARLLLETAEAAATPEVFPLLMTHQELASRLGTVREVVSRNLGRFQVEGLLRIEGRQIRVLDREGLEREAETEF